MILTVAEYKKINFLETTNDVELEKFIKRAEEVVRAVSNQELGGGEILPAPVLEEVKRAIAFQTEYYIIHGFKDDEFDTVKLGDFSYKLSGKRMISRMAIMCLKRAGVFYSSCEIRE